MSLKMSLMAAAFVATSAASAAALDAESAYDSGRFAEALALFEERGLEGDVQAQELVGMMHLVGPALFGNNVAADPARAANWFRAAALNGSAKGQFVLSQMYRTGVGVPVDAARAAALRGEATGRIVSNDTIITVER
ncbi:MAG: tetratricopeptide repeat protein [Burkholderiaceae bacterium]